MLVRFFTPAWFAIVIVIGMVIVCFVVVTAISKTVCCLLGIVIIPTIHFSFHSNIDKAPGSQITSL